MPPASGRPTRKRDSPRSRAPTRSCPSRGSHIVIRRDRLPADGGITIRIPGRVVFIIPWPGHWIIGTTDHPDPRRPEDLSAPTSDVDELLETVNKRIDVDLARGDIVGHVCRACARSSATPAARRSRRRASTASRPTRAASSGSRAASTRRTGSWPATSSTRRSAGPRHGSADRGRRTCRSWAPRRASELDQVAASLERPLRDAAAQRGQTRVTWPARVARRLADRYGREATEVARLSHELDLAVPLGERIDHLQGEVAWAARYELALSLDDVLARRMRLAQELPDRGRVDRAQGRRDPRRGARLGRGAAGRRGRPLPRDGPPRVRPALGG